MKITLRLFGSLREAMGESTIQVDLAEGARVVDLRLWLSERSSVVEELGDRLAASVNFEIAHAQDVLSDGDEVAFLPPVAGGDGRAKEGSTIETKCCTISASRNLPL